MTRLVFLFLSLTACGVVPLPAPADPDPVADLVWRDYGVQQVAPRPSLAWRREGLDCGAGRAWREPTLTDPETGEAQCVYGVTWTESWRSEVARPPEVAPSGTALAHEFNHARLYLTTGDRDDGHLDASFQTGGLVDQERARLRALEEAGSI